jgi:hypothetical protein
MAGLRRGRGYRCDRVWTKSARRALPVVFAGLVLLTGSACQPGSTGASAPTSARPGASAAPTTPAVVTTPAAPVSPADWPTEQDTGATGQLTDVTGPVRLTRDGQVYADKRVHGTVIVTACRVTIRNVEVDAGEPYTGNNTPDLFAVWLQQPASCGVVLDHVSVLAEPAPNVYVTTGIRDANGSAVTITGSKVIGAQMGILGVNSGVIRDNYVLVGPNMRGDHDDGLQIDGSSGLTIEHNTLLNPNSQTSALALFTEFGANRNDIVRNNLLAGGGFSCYCGDGKSDNKGNPARAVNVSIIGNVFWRKYYSDAGNFGYARAYNPAGGGQWSGNVYMNADGTLANEEAQQPPIDQ